jgi:hypothetical protein
MAGKSGLHVCGKPAGPEGFSGSSPAGPGRGF